jgi:hypothetical protein
LLLYSSKPSLGVFQLAGHFYFINKRQQAFWHHHHRAITGKDIRPAFACIDNDVVYNGGDLKRWA